MSIPDALFLSEEVNGVCRFRHKDVCLAAQAFENDVSGRVLGDRVPPVVVGEIG